MTDQCQDWLLEESTKRANSAVVLGRLCPSQISALSGYRHLFWLVDREGAKAWPSPPAEVSVLNLEAIQPEQLSQLLEEIVSLDSLCLPDLKISESVTRYHAGGYDFIIDSIRSSIDLNNRSRRTRQEEGAFWQELCIRHLAHYCRFRIDEQWEDVLRGRRAAVVGAGPSLEASLPRLAEQRGGFVVIAVDSALRSLEANGIAADVTVTIDAFKQPENCLPESGAGGLLVLSPTSPIEWAGIDSFARIAYLGGNLLTLDWLDAKGVSQPRIKASANCGISAILLASFLGCRSISLFGMDMASDPNKPTMRHAKESSNAIDRGKGYSVRGSQQLVAGNYHNEVPTFMLHELSSLAQLLQRLDTDHDICNINDRGAFLEGANLVHPKDFMAVAQSASSVGLASDLASVWPLSPPERRLPEEVLVALESIAHSLGECLASLQLPASSLSAICQSLMGLLGDEDVSAFLGSFSLKAMPHLVNFQRTDPEVFMELAEDVANLKRVLDALIADCLSCRS